MIYSVGGRRLNCIRKVLENETNDAWVVQDVSEQGNREYYTLLVVKRHETAKMLMEIWEEGRRNGRDTCTQTAVYQDEFCVLYPYQKERALKKFYNGKTCPENVCGEICRNLTAECISCGEVWPVLYLMLEQEQVHLERDNRVSLGYLLDLSGLDAGIDEHACVMQCASMVLELMRQNKNMEKTAGMRLIQKKRQKKGYACFTELLRDIHMDSGSWERVKLKERVIDFFEEKKWLIFRILLAGSVLLGITALLMILSQMVFGDIPFLRIFANSFETIGRESLLK